MKMTQNITRKCFTYVYLLIPVNVNVKKKRIRDLLIMYAYYSCMEEIPESININ